MNTRTITDIEGVAIIPGTAVLLYKTQDVGRDGFLKNDGTNRMLYWSRGMDGGVIFWLFTSGKNVLFQEYPEVAAAFLCDLGDIEKGRTARDLREEGAYRMRESIAQIRAQMPDDAAISYSLDWADDTVAMALAWGEQEDICDFFDAFAEAAGVPIGEAEAQWAALSSMLEDDERRKIESGGRVYGQTQGEAWKKKFGGEGEFLRETPKKMD